MRVPVDIEMARCVACGHVDAITCVLCAKCLGTEMAAHAVPGRGRLATWTTIRRPPTRFCELAPYYVCVVDLDSGPRVTGRIDTLAGAKSGAPVMAVPCESGIRLFTLA
ncbi:MAG: OB-fold domain-containing protein [Salinisphaera sp.]|jgi:uncharacterized OB-fold protein|nr:OB-fold domain-containing protein [Salinisphaera sp.]